MCIAIRQAVGIVALGLIADAHAQVPAPLPQGIVAKEYYPEGPRRLGHMARVVLQFQPSQFGRGVKPLSIALDRVDMATLQPEPYVNQDPIREMFVRAAESLVRQLLFKDVSVGQTQKRVSVLFLLEPCDQLQQDTHVDYYIVVCQEPR